MKNPDHKIDMAIYACIGISMLASFIAAVGTVVYLIRTFA